MFLLRSASYGFILRREINGLKTYIEKLNNMEMFCKDICSFCLFSNI